MASARRYVRQMPQIYGNLQPQPKRGLRWVAVFLRFFFVFGSAALLLYAIFFGPAFRINYVTVSGAEFSSAADAQAQVAIGSNIWLLSSAFVKAEILKSPAVESVEVLRGVPHTVRIEITEKRPALLWQTGSQLVLLDSTGTVFGYLPASSLATDPRLVSLSRNVPLVVDEKGLPFAIGQPLVSPTFITFVDQAAQDVQTRLPQLTLDHFAVSDSTYDVTLYAKQGLQVRLSALGDPGVETSNLGVLLSKDKLPLTSKIDLRVDRWAYVT
jgi:hypothetical protein